MPRRLVGAAPLCPHRRIGYCGEQIGQPIEMMRLCAFGTELQLVKRIGSGVRVAPPLPRATNSYANLRFSAIGFAGRQRLCGSSACSRLLRLVQVLRQVSHGRRLLKCRAALGNKQHLAISGVRPPREMRRTQPTKARLRFDLEPSRFSVLPPNQRAPLLP
jgi:hypothetical protein